MTKLTNTQIENLANSYGELLKILSNKSRIKYHMSARNSLHEIQILAGENDQLAMAIYVYDM